MEHFHVQAPFGLLNVVCAADAVHAIHFLPAVSAAAPVSGFARQVADELAQYFANPQFVFTVPVQLTGTAFQCRLWQALRAIPAGEVRRYGELSAQLASSARAVGGACRRNPVPIIVPCHRVVAASGAGGFAGAVSGPLLTIKHWLLRHEGICDQIADTVDSHNGRTGDLFANAGVMP